MNILGYISGFDGCGLFRLQIPFKYMNREPGITAKISFVYDKEEIEWADIIIVQKQYQESVVPYVKMAQAMGRPVVLEFDDLMTEIPDWNMASKFYGNKKDQILNFIQLCNACTVSTPYLKLIHDGLNSNIKVLPNSMDMPQCSAFKDLSNEDLYKYTIFQNPRFLNSREPTKRVLPQEEALAKLRNRLKIIWWGSPTHEKDLQVVDKTLAKLCSEHPEILIVKMGCCTSNFLDYMEKYMDQLVIVNPVQVHNFHQALYSVAKTGPTITVCPIVDLPFNRAKSNLKVIEGFMINSAVVASKVENYAKTITHGVNGFLADNTVDKHGIAPDWYEKLKALITDPIQRHFFAENGMNTVTNHYNIEKNVDLWLAAYQDIIQKSHCGS